MSATFPPVPKWRPSFSQPIDRIEERIGYYFNQERDFAILENGTCVLLRLALPMALHPWQPSRRLP
ncbi:hypothetical protein NKI19_05865 [Mesorhizobium sp. M0751]|uniref:hypothetical protein n=1 Tax=unclassified Mesorhizobium TaxID=325217 RepID=UPI00333CBBAD